MTKCLDFCHKSDYSGMYDDDDKYIIMKEYLCVTKAEANIYPLDDPVWAQPVCLSLVMMMMIMMMMMMIMMLMMLMMLVILMMMMMYGYMKREIAGPRGGRVPAYQGNLISETGRIRMIITYIYTYEIMRMLIKIRGGSKK